MYGLSPSTTPANSRILTIVINDNGSSMNARRWLLCLSDYVNIRKTVHFADISLQIDANPRSLLRSKFSASILSRCDSPNRGEAFYVQSILIDKANCGDRRDCLCRLVDLLSPNSVINLKRPSLSLWRNPNIGQRVRSQRRTAAARERLQVLGSRITRTLYRKQFRSK